MNAQAPASIRYFVTYSGVKLPLSLNTELQEGDLRNRITFYRASYDAAGRMSLCEKVVYGEIESLHHYAYYPEGQLREARIVLVADEECTVMTFTEDGTLLSSVDA
jgi:hypothetical protein